MENIAPQTGVPGGPADAPSQHHHHYYVQQVPQTVAVAAVPQHMIAAAAPGNGLATASLTLGVLAVVLCWVPVIGLILALVGLGLGIPALIKGNRSRIGQTAAIWGLSLSGVSLLIFLLIVALA